MQIRSPIKCLNVDVIATKRCSTTTKKKRERKKKVRSSLTAVAQSHTIWSVLEREAVNIAEKPGRYQVCKPGPCCVASHMLT